MLAGPECRKKKNPSHPICIIVRNDLLDQWQNSIQIFGWFLFDKYFLHQNIMGLALEFLFSTVIFFFVAFGLNPDIPSKRWRGEKNHSNDVDRIFIYDWQTWLSRLHLTKIYVFSRSKTLVLLLFKFDWPTVRAIYRFILVFSEKSVLWYWPIIHSFKRRHSWATCFCLFFPICLIILSQIRLLLLYNIIFFDNEELQLELQIQTLILEFKL